LEVQPDEADVLPELPVDALAELPVEVDAVAELPCEEVDVLPDLPLEELRPELPCEEAPESVSAPRFWASPQPSIGAELVSARVIRSQISW
jgi:hypothetical protein